MKEWIVVLVLFVLSMALLLLGSCLPPKEEPQLEGFWLGTYQHELLEAALPKMFYVLNDSMMVFYEAGEEPKEVDYDLEGDLLFIDTTEYFVAFLTEKELRVKNGKIDQTFTHIVEKELDEKEAVEDKQEKD